MSELAQIDSELLNGDFDPFMVSKELETALAQTGTQVWDTKKKNKLLNEIKNLQAKINAVTSANGNVQKEALM